MGDFYSQMKLRESAFGAEAPFRETEARLTFCVVTAVDIQNRSVSIKHAGSSLEESNISYTSMSANSKAGEDNIPSKGDVAVVAMMASGTKIILGFVGGSNRSAEIALGEGDMLSKSLGDSIVKQDADGNLFISTQDGSHLLLTKQGDLKVYASSLEFETPFIKTTEGEAEGIPFQKREVFGETPSLAETADETIRLILEDEALTFKPRVPVIAEHLGGKVDSEGNLSLLDIGLVPLKEIVYSKEIRNKTTGEIVFSEEIDSDGNMRMSGGKILIDGTAGSGIPKIIAFRNRVELNASATVIPVGINAWTPNADDTLFVFVGGIFQTEGVEYTFDPVAKTISGSWDAEFVIDFLVMKTGEEEGIGEEGERNEYRLVSFKNRVILDSDVNVIAVDIPEWSPNIDEMFVVFVGGIYQREGVEYTIDSENRTILGTWESGTIIDFLVTKYVQVVASDVYLDGHMLNPDSVERGALSTSLREELDYTAFALSEINVFFTQMMQEIAGGFSLKADITYVDDSVMNELSKYRLNIDANSIATEIRYKREDATLFKKSVLSGGTSPLYTTRTVTYYEADGITVKKTVTYAISYIGDDFLNEVIV